MTICADPDAARRQAAGAERDHGDGEELEALRRSTG